MTDLDDNLLRRAKDGDRNAIFVALDRYGVDPIIIKNIAAWHPGRERDYTVFINLVNARKHYVKRGWVRIPKSARIRELVDRFGLSSNVADHIADGNGYADVRKEAQRQLTAEADENIIPFSSVGFPTP